MVAESGVMVCLEINCGASQNVDNVGVCLKNGHKTVEINNNEEDALEKSPSNLEYGKNGFMVCKSNAIQYR